MTDDLILVSQRLSDAELSLRIRQLARVESRLTALLVAHLAEFDSRRLYLGEGYMVIAAANVVVRQRSRISSCDVAHTTSMKLKRSSDR